MDIKERYLNVLKDSGLEDEELLELEAIDKVMLITYLEREFNIKIDDEEFLKCKIHHDAIEYIKILTNGKS